MSNYVSKVIYPDGSEKRVKNLGWLLRHRNDVEKFGVFKNHKREISAVLQAVLVVNGQRLVYETDYACTTILRFFLTRPAWYGIDVLWTIGEDASWGLIPGTYTIGREWTMKKIGY